MGVAEVRFPLFSPGKPTQESVPGYPFRTSLTYPGSPVCIGCSFGRVFLK